jgi:hypothetical protein
MPQICKPLRGLLAAACLDDPITIRTAAVLNVEVFRPEFQHLHQPRRHFRNKRPSGQHIGHIMDSVKL